MILQMKIKQNIIQNDDIFRSSIQNINNRRARSGKTNALLNLINNQSDIDKIYLYAKHPYEAKYRYLINNREDVGISHLDDPESFIEYSNDIQDVCKNIEEYNPEKKHKILIVFDDMISDMISKKKLNPIVTELFTRSRKLNINNCFYYTIIF